MKVSTILKVMSGVLAGGYFFYNTSANATNRTDFTCTGEGGGSFYLVTVTSSENIPFFSAEIDAIGKFSRTPAVVGKYENISEKYLGGTHPDEKVFSFQNEAHTFSLSEQSHARLNATLDNGEALALSVSCGG